MLPHWSTTKEAQIVSILQWWRCHTIWVSIWRHNLQYTKQTESTMNHMDSSATPTKWHQRLWAEEVLLCMQNCGTCQLQECHGVVETNGLIYLVRETQYITGHFNQAFGGNHHWLIFPMACRYQVTKGVMWDIYCSTILTTSLHRSWRMGEQAWRLDNVIMAPSIQDANWRKGALDWRI